MGHVARFFHDIREGARRQANVIFALIFRELKSRQGVDGYGLLSLVGVMLEPALGVIAVSLFWYIFRRQEVLGVHIVLFLAVSFTAFGIVRRSLSTIPRTVRGNRAFYAFPNIKPFDAVLARFIIEVVLTLMGGIVLLFLLWWFLDLHIDMRGFLEGMGILGLLSISGLGLSLFLGVYGGRFPVIFKVIGLFSRVLLICSAVIHPAYELPPEAQKYLAWNPLAHGMELIRLHLLDIPPFPQASIEYLAGFAIVSLFLGFIGYYVNRHKVLER